MSDLPPLPDDPDAALAAEFVLRLLPPEEEAFCAARTARDPAFAEEVARWRAAFGALDAAYAPVAPPRALKGRVEAALFGETTTPSLAARLWANAALWRGVAVAAVIAALAVSVPAWRAPAPDLVARVAPIASDVQFVALLDRTAGALRFVRIAGEAPRGRSLELWLIPVGATEPVSLGLVPEGERFAVPLTPTLAGRVAPGAQILVSDEVAGGSPTGLPQGTVQAGGTVSEL